MENVVLTYFDVESEGYQAISELKKVATFEDRFTLSQVALIKKEDGQIYVKESFDTGKRTNDDLLKGGLIGGLIGILAGPVGILLGMWAGASVGSLKDARDLEVEDNLLLSITSRLIDGDEAIIAVIEEKTEEAYDRVMDQFDSVTIRYDAQYIRKEVNHAFEVQKHLHKEAREKMREVRSQARHSKMEVYKNKMKEQKKRLFPN
ncbi:MAG: DUF1269 domain-containing protein [Bacillus sp. (in: firmicutes)]